jgi:hypothetical protein
MVYNTQNYWGFGLCPSFNIVETRKHNISKTGSVSALKGDTYFFGALERANLSHWTVEVSSF